MTVNISVFAQIRRRYIMAALMERDRNRCQHCGRVVRRARRRWLKDGHPQPDDMATMDHIVPQARGGSDKLDNLLLSCRRCNCARGSMSLEAFRSSIRHREGGAP